MAKYNQTTYPSLNCCTDHFIKYLLGIIYTFTNALNQFHQIMYSTQSQLHNFEVNSLKRWYFGGDSSLRLKFSHMQRMSERLAAPLGPAKGLPAGCSVWKEWLHRYVCVSATPPPPPPDVNGVSVLATNRPA
ncbi:cyclic AMP-dependent transcription factor ATF-2 [Platysternon megacephalum]|uniref:Cyclic AMP-dependent transcription factor ATF-2 n=1 Tax=Platysternon megacephalum TaxID=55544 RepID=A0A4D9EZG1_9SAUR|nr:cyclic AMP-dependent transcription factor ATF-2 [Platysternon megacephalum]